MIDKQVDAEFVKYKSTLVLARELLVEGDYQQSQLKYAEALATARELFPETSNDVASCLLGRGDSCYAANNFTQAKEAFEAALKLYLQLKDVDAKQLIAVGFRVAKAQTESLEFTQADASFIQIIERAETVLGPSDPLLTLIYEAYANMLDRSHIDPGKAFQYRQKARAQAPAQIMQKNPNRRTFELSASKRAEQPTESFFDEEELTSITSAIVQAPTGWFKRHRYISLALLMVPFIIALNSLCKSLAPNIDNLTFPTSLGTFNAQRLNEFSSPDEREKLSLWSTGTAESVIDGTSKLLPYVRPRPGWSEIFSLFMFTNKGDQWLITKTFDNDHESRTTSDLQDRSFDTKGITRPDPESKRLIIYRYSRINVFLFWSFILLTTIVSVFPLSETIRYLKHRDSNESTTGAGSSMYWNKKLHQREVLYKLWLSYAFIFGIACYWWNIHFNKI